MTQEEKTIKTIPQSLKDKLDALPPKTPEEIAKKKAMAQQFVDGLNKSALEAVSDNPNLDEL